MWFDVQNLALKDGVVEADEFDDIFILNVFNFHVVLLVSGFIFLVFRAMLFFVWPAASTKHPINGIPRPQLPDSSGSGSGSCSGSGSGSGCGCG